MFKVLYNPGNFFRHRIEGPSLAKPALVVLLVGLVDAARGWLVFQSIRDAMTASTSVMSAVSQIGGSLANLFLVFFMWFAYAGVFYALSTAFEGEGSFGRTLKFVGWGYVPAIFSSLITVAAMYVALQGLTPPETMEAVPEFSRRLREQSIFPAARLVSTAFVLWQGFIWAFAVKYSRKLSLREAAITVGIPVGLTILWDLFNLL